MTQSDAKKLPEWARPLFRSCSDDLHDLIRLRQITQWAIRRQRGAVPTVQLLSRLEDIEGDAVSKEAQAKRLAQAQDVAAFAQRESEGGFRVLLGQTTVSIWSSLENLVFNLVTQTILHNPEVLQGSVFNQVKVKVGDIVLLDDHTRAEFLALQLDEQTSGSLRLGIGRFETLLKPFGLSGDFKPEDRSRDIFEMQQIRNLWAHRQGIPDKRFCTVCPWVKAKPREPLALTDAMVDRYFGATIDYMSALIARTTTKYGK